MLLFAITCALRLVCNLTSAVSGAGMQNMFVVVAAACGI